MKLLSFFHNENKIEIHNNWLGKETILYNGEEMSAQYSFMGSTHKFSVLEDDIPTDYIVEVGFAYYGVGFNIIRNGEVLMESFSNHSCRRRQYKGSEFV